MLKMKTPNNPIATSTSQSRQLIEHGIPASSADMYKVRLWNNKWELRIPHYHYNMEMFTNSEEHISSWLLSRLIDLLPPELNYGEDEDSMQYDLVIESDSISYKTYSGETFIETYGLTILSAVVEMIISLCREGWLDIIKESYQERFGIAEE